MLISFEGGEGSGKSTQAKLLSEYLTSQNIDNLLTREPGGRDNNNAEFIRSILVAGDYNWEGLTEVFLHSSARIEHLSKTVTPALKEGKIVITDRFFDSTLVYQGYGHGVDTKTIEQVNQIATGGRSPDITFIFDIEVEKGLDRAGERKDEEDKYEKLGLEFHKRIRKGFLEVANNNPERCIIIDANDTIENLHKKVVSVLKEKNYI